MATWHGEPYPGYFNDAIRSNAFLTQLNECFMPDNKWILNKKEGDNSPMSEFAELNAAVLEIIHNEKRFPTKEEMAELKFVSEPLIENLWSDFKFDLSRMNTTFTDASPTFTFTNDSDTGIYSSSTDTVTVSTGATSSDFVVHFNGTTAVDFAEPLPKSALLSTKGCNNYNTSEKFLNEIKNYE